MKNRNKKILISSILLCIFSVCFITTYAFFQYSGYSKSIKYTTGIIDVTLNSDTENINVTNMFPMEYDDMLSLNLDNKLEFNLEGTNESYEDFYYEIKIINGDEPEENSDDDLTNDLTRIDPKYINFDIYYHDDTLNKDYYYIMNGNLNDYLNEGVVVGKLSNNSSIDDDFIVRLWINDDVIIGNKSTSIYSQEEWVKLFASFKVQVDCDNTYREMKYSYTKKAQDTKTNLFSLYNYRNEVFSEYGSNYSDNRLYLERSTYDEENLKISYYFPNNEFFRSKALNTTVINFNKVSTSDLEELKTTLGTDNYYDHTNSLMVGKQTIGYFNQTNDDSDNPVYEYNLVSDGIIVFPEDSANMFELVYNTSGSSTAAWDGMYNSSSTTKSYLNQIEYINFNNVYTGNTTDFGYWFMNHTSLKEIDLSNIDTRNATRLSGMFLCATGLTELDVSNFDTSRATKMDWMFSGLNVTEIEGIEDFETNRVTLMSEMFADSVNLVSLDLSNWRVNNVEHFTNYEVCYKGNIVSSGDIGYKQDTYTWYFDFYLRYYPGRKVYSSTSSSGTTAASYIGSPFVNCKSLTYLNISNWEFDSASTLAYFFEYMVNLDTLIMDNVDTGNITNFSYMFCQCRKLTNIPFENIDTSSGEYLTGMFYGSYLTTFDFSSMDFSSAIEVDQFFRGSSTLTTLTGTANGSSIKLFSQMFYNCKALNSVNVTMNTSGGIDFTYMFARCEKLPSCDWAIDTSNATYLNYMYSECYALKYLDMSNFNTSKATYFAGMFSLCYNLDSDSTHPFDATKLDTSSAVNLASLFNSCYGLKQATIDDIEKFDVSNCTNFSSMLSGIHQNNTIDLSGWDVSNALSVSYMFSDCYFTSINISNWDLSKCTDYSYMFESVMYVTTITLTNVKVNCHSDDETINYDYMFYDCRELETLDLTSFNWDDSANTKEGTYTITTNYMFSNCSKLTTITATTGKFIDTYIDSSTNMFTDCSVLTNGTNSYSSSNANDKTNISTYITFVTASE